MTDLSSSEAKANDTLPMAARELLPHRPPMCFIDQLVAVSGQDGTAECCLPADAIIVDAEGNIEPAALLELMAQAYATVRGYDSRQQQGAAAPGFLVGCRHVKMYQPARAGRPLNIQVATVSIIGGFAVAEAEVWCEHERLASGTIKIWVPPQEAPAA